MCAATPTCSDMTENGNETGVDCGGMNMCPRCPNGQGCNSGGDCQSSVCSIGMNVCLAPLCNDSVKNGTETDVDCGGGTCPGCGPGGDCVVASDCLSTICTGNLCQ
jgi:hypothetical protein